MKLKDPPADMDVPQEIEIRMSNIDSDRMGTYSLCFVFIVSDFHCLCCKQHFCLWTFLYHLHRAWCGL